MNPSRFQWPAALDGHARQVGPAGRCVDCPPGAHLKDSITFTRYGDLYVCLPHAIRRADAAQKGARPEP